MKKLASHRTVIRRKLPVTICLLPGQAEEAKKLAEARYGYSLSGMIRRLLAEEMAHKRGLIGISHRATYTPIKAA